MGITNIEWTATVNLDGTVTKGRSWNPVRGCSRVSPGCVNCYAEAMAARLSAYGRKPDSPFAMFVEKKNGHASWTGKVGLVEKHLFDPLSWKAPCKVFVNSMSDLFHEDLPDEHIERVFAVMSLCPQHTFIILTKRAERMRKWFEGDGPIRPRQEHVSNRAYAMSAVHGGGSQPRWPLPNVHLGVSVESQKYADERIPELLRTPAATRIVSYEPALEQVVFKPEWLQGFFWEKRGGHNAALQWDEGRYQQPAPKLNQIIIGGESGPGARPFDIRWATSTVDVCAQYKTACFVKQLGADPWESGDGDHGPNAGNRLLLKDKKGGDPEEWDPRLRVRQFPKVMEVI